MRVGPTTLFIVTLFAGSVHAATGSTTEDVVALQAQVLALTQRLATLEERDTKRSIPVATYASQRQAATQAAHNAPRPASWTDTIKLKGDYRFRHESIDAEFGDERHRQRIRARPAITAEISDTVSVGFGLATGGNDPVSSNQTLGGGGSSKSVVIDLAYASWTTPVDGLSVQGGKFKNPFHRTGGNGLLWDGDLRPEGVAFRYDKNDLFVHALGLSVAEDSSGEDAFLVGTQAGLTKGIGEGKLLAGIGYYNFTDAEGREPFFDGDPRGNQVNPDGTYANGFELIEGFAEYSFVMFDSQITLFADYVQNLDASDLDTGYAVGTKIKRNDWQFGWAYQDLEADAVVATFTDSDFIGGGTDGKGHILQAGYALTKQIGLKGTLFLNERNMDIGTEEDYTRFMLDVSFKY